MNILLTCAGRRNHLVHYFRDALGKRGLVIACDTDPRAPALADADLALVVPPIDHADYFDILWSICRDRRVRLVVSVSEIELPGLARQAERFRALGTILLVASPETVAACQDKWAAHRWLNACGLATPETFLSLDDARAALVRGAIRFPLLIKPRWGMSSIGVETVDTEHELELAHEWVKVQIRRSIVGRLGQNDPQRSLLIQEKLDGQEYGIDVVNDLQGRYITTLMRRKLAMRAGNTDRAITVHDSDLERIGAILGRRLAQPGSVDCDLILTEKGYHVLDVNPRLGGGYPFSHLAGANLPAALIAWANDEEPDSTWLRPRSGVLSARYEGVSILDHLEPNLAASPIVRPIVRESFALKEPEESHR